MSQPALNANKSSALLNSLQQQKTNDFFSYDLESNSVNQVNCNIIKLAARNDPAPGSALSSDISFKLPRNGLMMDACFVVTARPAATQAGSRANNVGSRLFREVSLKAQSKTIHSYSDSYVQSRLLADTSEKTLSAIQLAKGDIDLTQAGAATKFVLPFYSTFLDASYAFLDLSFVEDMSIDIKVNDAAGMGITTTFDMFEVVMYIRYINMDAETHAAYIANNFPTGRQLNMLITDVYEETRVPITSGSAVTIDVPMKCPYVVKRTFIHLSDATSLGPSKAEKINSISCRFSGNLAFDTIPVEVMRYLNIRDSPACLNTNVINADVATVATDIPNIVQVNDPYSSGGNVHVINWGLNESTLVNSGAISFGNINNPQLTVNFVATGNTTTVVRVTHEILKLVAIDAQSGYITSSYAT